MPEDNLADAPDKDAAYNPDDNPPDGDRYHGNLARGDLSALQKKARVFQCLQCHKCSAGCPVTDRGDLQTSQIVRLTQLKDTKTLLRSTAIWRCTGCQTCTTRCPAGVDPAHLQDLLKRESLKAGYPPSDPRTFEAADAFLHTVRKNGRLVELSMVRRFKSQSRTLFERFSLGVALFFRGKLKLTRNTMRDKKAVKALIDAKRVDAKRITSDDR